MILRTRILVSLIWLLSTGWVWSVDAASGWTGLWRIEQRSTLSGAIVLHLFVPDGAKTGKNPVYHLYRPGWEEQPTLRLSASGNDLKIGMDLAGKPIKFDVKRSGDQLSGHWLMGHPQFPQDGRVTGFRIHREGDWELFTGLQKLRTDDGLMDFAGFLAREAPAGDEAFLRYWNETIVPDFYVLYNEFFVGQAIYDRALTRERVRAVQMAVKQPDFKTKVSGFAGVYRKVRKELSGEYKEMGILNSLVTMPPVEGLEAATRKLEGGLLTVVDVEEATKRWSSEQLPYFIAQQVLKTPILLSYPGISTVSMELFKDGLRSYLAGRLKYSSDLSSQLLMSRSEFEKVEREHSKYVSKIGKILTDGATAYMEMLFEEEPRPGLVFGYSFVEWLAKKRSPKQLLEMATPDVYSEAEVYFELLQ